MRLSAFSALIATLMKVGKDRWNIYRVTKAFKMNEHKVSRKSAEKKYSGLKSRESVSSVLSFIRYMKEILRSYSMEKIIEGHKNIPLTGNNPSIIEGVLSGGEVNSSSY